VKPSKVQVDTSHFRNAHGKEPRGFGAWAFFFAHSAFCSRPLLIPACNYSDAVKIAKGKAAEKGVGIIYTAP